VWHCVFRHLAVAAGELGREAPDAAGLAQRLAGAEVRYRTLADPRSEAASWRAQPWVDLGASAARPLAELLVEWWGRRRQYLPERGLDRELVELAKQLLSEVEWTLPDAVAPAT
jgi:hypothetical protein